MKRWCQHVLPFLCLVIPIAALSGGEHTVAIDVALQSQKTRPLIWMLVKNEDTGALTPHMFRLNSLTDYQYFKVKGDHYTIKRFEAQLHGQQRLLCHFDPNQMIRDESLTIHLGGAATDQLSELSCQARFIAGSSVIDVSNYRRGGGGASSPAAPSVDSSPSAAGDGADYAGIVDYLNALSVCEKGRYPADVNGKSIVYTVQGQVLKNCDVIIQIKGTKKPINCSFSPAAVNYLTSSEQIAMYQSGRVNISNKSKVTQVMNDSCH